MEAPKVGFVTTPTCERGPLLFPHTAPTKADSPRPAVSLITLSAGLERSIEQRPLPSHAFQRHDGRRDCVAIGRGGYRVGSVVNAARARKPPTRCSERAGAAVSPGAAPTVGGLRGDGRRARARCERRCEIHSRVAQDSHRSCGHHEANDNFVATSRHSNKETHCFLPNIPHSRGTASKKLHEHVPPFDSRSAQWTNSSAPWR